MTVSVVSLWIVGSVVLVPVIVIVCVPAAAPATVTVRVAEDWPPATGAGTGFSDQAKLKPDPVAVRLTGVENDPRDCTVIVDVPDALAPRESEAGLTEIEKPASPGPAEAVVNSRIEPREVPALLVARILNW
jgi:hypothetical protein